MSADILIAGIGNIFLSDDGFGVEVANHLSARSWPDSVEVAEFGIRGVHLAYQLLDGYRVLILVDAVPMGERPGTLALLEPERPGSDDAAIDAHTMSPDVVLGVLDNLGGSLDHVYVVGCEPEVLAEGIGLSPSVAAAVSGAVALCEGLVSELVTTAGKGVSG